MKKCPYCAEDIQDEAKKCKHCGEWLTVSQDGKNISDEPDAVQKEIKKDEINTDLNTTANEAQITVEAENPEVMDDEDTSKYRALPGAKSLIKKPGKYGWGWILFFGMLANYNVRNDPFSDAALSLLWDTLTFLFLILYFWLRRKFIVKWKYARWKPGLVAGLCIYLVAAVVLGTMAFFDAKSINSTIASVTARYKDKVEFFKQEEGKYQAKLITEPQAITDIKQNIKAIDEILEHANAKQQFFHSMFNDYKTALKDKRNTKSKKPWGEVIDNIVSQSDKTYLKQKRALELLRDYYVTGNEKSYQEYTTIYQETEQLANEFRKLVKETF